MKKLDNYKVILWDFDGVIMDSMPIRRKGFEEVLKDFPQNQVEELLTYHEKNGGLSRYVKFRYFFEKIRNEPIVSGQILEMAENFSKIMLSLLLNKELLIEDSVNFIRNNWMDFNMHIVSGSDGKELNFICKELGLEKYFISINGSPTPKNELVKNVINDSGYDKREVVLIGDSINDLDASQINGISFYGYNCEELKKYGNYIETFNLL